MLNDSTPPLLRKRRTQQERSAATQERLLEATIACIVEYGYAGTSTTLVCQRAGVSRGAQVHHFPTKAALVASAIERLFARRHEEFRASLGAQADLHGAFAQLWRLYTTGPTVPAWVELLVAARTDATLRAQLKRVDERFFDEAKVTCRLLVGLPADDEAVAPGLARLILSVFDGLALNRTLGHPEASYEAPLRLLEAMLAGARHTETAPVEVG